jgi:hypothetical protein
VAIFLSLRRTWAMGYSLGALAVSNRWRPRPFCETLSLAPVGLIGAS